MKPSRDIARLIEIMAALRTPGTGCPWDLEQDFATIAPYTIEEAYEVADAIARGDLDDLRDELGDLLLQVVFHARMAQEQGAFDFGDVVQAITEKAAAPASACVRRGARARRRRRSSKLWERIKAEEKAARGQTRAASTKARWPASRSRCPPSPARSSCRPRPARSASTGTIRWRCSPRSARRRRDRSRDRRPASSDKAAARGRRPAVRRGQSRPPSGGRSGGRAAATNAKFERRFAAIERALAGRGTSPRRTTLAEMDALWDAAKTEE